MKIYLCGFMGSGKSTLGKKISRQLDYSFYDLDIMIEKNTGLSINSIFNKHGETQFRKLEREALLSTVNLQNSVIALGGGTCCNELNMNFIQQNGISIYFQVEKDMLYGRLKTLKTERPLISELTDIELKEFISNKLSERIKFYEKCDFTYVKEESSFNFLISQLQSYIK